MTKVRIKTWDEMVNEYGALNDGPREFIRFEHGATYDKAGEDSMPKDRILTKGSDSFYCSGEGVSDLVWAICPEMVAEVMDPYEDDVDMHEVHISTIDGAQEAASRGEGVSFDRGDNPAPREVFDKEPDPKKQAGDLKAPLHLLPTIAMREEAYVLQLGEVKYGLYNWRKSEGVRATTYSAALMRHLLQFMDGEDEDSESGRSHLAHIRATCSILMDADSVGKLIDDRQKVSK